ncbi:group II intron maturase-specific domain-containing protein [Paraburkholderia aspalathi]|uniref:group II intron maturase-specific domain-containing protein n=1 Tax=Paraburkholderia aspalathi TaxID=1324617 RepID=UPI0038B9B028
MSGDVHVRFREHPRGQFPRVTRLIITGATREVLADDVRPTVELFLAERGLSLSSEKTRITHIDEGFDFLGMNVRKYSGKLLIKPARASVQRFLRKLRETVKNSAMVRHDQLIRELNPLLRGWANYYRHVVAKHTFGRVSHEIWRCLWRWAKRRHPNKSSRWVRQKYFRIVGLQHWVFGTETGNPLSTGKPELLTLYDIAGTPIRRHRKIKAAANPFDLQWEGYFEERLRFAMLDSLKGRVQLIRLWLDQARSCPVCQQMITKTSGWSLCHVVRKIDGGKDTTGNLTMLHPECHRVARALGLSVVKPAHAHGL